MPILKSCFNEKQHCFLNLLKYIIKRAMKKIIVTAYGNNLNFCNKICRQGVILSPNQSILINEHYTCVCKDKHVEKHSEIYRDLHCTSKTKEHRKTTKESNCKKLLLTEQEVQKMKIESIYLDKLICGRRIIATNHLSNFLLPSH